MRTKKVHIEFMRIIACFLVIVNHTNSDIFLNTTPSSVVWFISLTYFFISKIAVPLFLMIMGALLLEKCDTPRKSLKRFLRIFITLVIASIAYYIYYASKDSRPIQAIEFINLFSNYSATNSFWYLYLYLGLLCILPILQKLTKALNKRDLQYLLFLSIWMLGIIPVLHIFIPIITLNGLFSEVIFCPYIGMVLYGYYIEHNMVINRKRTLYACFIFALLIFFQVFATYYLFQKDSNNYLPLDNREFITITGSAICFYIICKYLFSKIHLPVRIERAICHIGGLTFGIYLLADWMIQVEFSVRVYDFLCRYMSNMAAIVLWEIFIFVACAFITAFFKGILFLGAKLNKLAIKSMGDF